MTAGVGREEEEMKLRREDAAEGTEGSGTGPTVQEALL